LQALCGKIKLPQDWQETSVAELIFQLCARLWFLLPLDILPFGQIAICYTSSLLLKKLITSVKAEFISLLQLQLIIFKSAPHLGQSPRQLSLQRGFIGMCWRRLLKTALWMSIALLMMITSLSLTGLPSTKHSLSKRLNEISSCLRQRLQLVVKMQLAVPVRIKFFSVLLLVKLA